MSRMLKDMANLRFHLCELCSGDSQTATLLEIVPRIFHTSQSKTFVAEKRLKLKT